MPPAPVDRSAPIASGPTTPGDDVYIVQRGEGLNAIARTLGVAPRALIEANGLTPPYVLRIGQRLTVPRNGGRPAITAGVHMVEPGETLNAIARRHGLDVADLARHNRLEPPHVIRAGQRLELPGAPPPATASGPDTVPTAAPTRSVEVASLPPPTRPARPAPVADPPASEPAAAPIVLTPAPPAEPPVTTAPAVIAPILPAPTVPVAPAAEPPPPQPLPSPAQVQAPTQEPAQAPAQSVPTAATPAPPPRAGRNFQWPVRGRVIQDFGPQGRGLQNDGLNIAAARGTPFRAAENGVVVYAGDEIKGFGNLLLVRHADGFVTAYAHAESLAVRPGDVVRRGQVIGRVGNSGGVDQPQLHFEVRRGTEPVDPRPLLAQPTG